jgi:ABC-type transport system involved in multi-copper enzyme maturation permease subunit
MTTESPAAPAPNPPPLPPSPAVPAAGSRPLAGDLLSAEWTKIRSVRSTVWTLIIFVVISLGLTALFTWLTVANWNGPRAADRDARVALDPVGFIMGSGLGLGQLTICVLGVLVITTEYSTGVIRASLLAVPRRIEMLTAKAVVFAALMIVVAEIVVFGSFFIGSAILHGKVAVSLSDRNVTRAVVGSGLYLTVLGLFSLAIGTLIRHTAGAITTAIGVVFVLPILAGLLPGGCGAHVNGYLPEQAGILIGQQHPPADGNVLSAWEGFGLFCLWTAVLLALGGYLLHRRDA